MQNVRKTLIYRLKQVKIPLLLTFPLMLLAVTLLPGCIDEPISPSWDLQVNAPVTNKSYTLLEAIEKDTKQTLKYDATTKNLYYTDNRPVTAIRVDDKLKLSPSSKEISFAIQKLSLNPASSSTSVKLSQFGGIFSGNSGSTELDIPAIQTTINQNLADIASFKEVDLESGTMTLTITNNTHGKLSIRLDQITITNRLDGAVVFKVTESTIIKPQESKSFPASLAGKKLRNQMAAEITLSTVAGKSTVNSEEEISFGFQMSNLIPSRMIAQIPDQAPFSDTSSFQLDETSAIKLVTVKKGKLVYTLTNNFPTKVTAQFSIPELRTSAGQTYTNSITLEKGEIKPITLSNLTDWSLQSTNAGYTNRVSFQVTTAVPSSGSEYVEISKTNSVKINVNLDTLTLKNVNGKMKATALEPKTTAIALNLGSLDKFTAANIYFKNFLLDLNLGMSAQTKIRLDNAKIEGSNSQTKKTLSIPVTILNGASGTQKITLNQTELNNFLNAFVTKPPDSLYIKYTATVNPAAEAIVINDADSVYGNSTMNIPLDLGISGGTITDTSEVEIPSSNRDKLDNVQSGTIKLKIENGIAADVVFRGKLYGESGNYLMDIPPGTPNTITVAAASVDNNGLVTAPGYSDVTITLNNEQIKKFLDSKKMIFTLNFSTTANGAAPVKFRTTDYIKVFAAGQLNYLNKP